MNLKHIIFQTLLLAAAVAGSACDDWTELRPLDIESQRPEAATEAMYEAAVREFRASNHQLVLGRFDNATKIPALRPQHINVLPDSIDMVILAHPDSLCERELTEMREMREAYATQYLCEVTYSYVEALWNEANAAEEPDENPDARLQARRKAFFEPVAQWRENHAGKRLLLGGSLDLLDDRTLTDACDYLLADGRSASAMGSAAEAFFRLENAGFPAERILLAVAAPDAQGAGGVFGSQSALTATAEWLLEPARTGIKAGMLIDNIQNDYFDTGLIFRNTRKAIDILNPSPKN